MTAGDTASTHALGVALIESVDATQDLLLDQVALMRADLRSDVSRVGRSGAALLGGAALTALGHSLLLVAAGLLLVRVLPLEAVLGLLGLPHLIFGLLAIRWGATALGAPE